MDAMVTTVREFIRRHGLIGGGERALLSLSAGKDSMFLLHVIEKLRGEMGFEAGIFHLNHMMRGTESDLDEAFVRAAAERFGMEFHGRRHDFKNRGCRGMSFEEEARSVRYRMLREIAAAHGYSVIVTAHSRDDQVETVLMRILTGTGIHGLRGILPKRNAIVRPLLEVSADEIYGYLRANGIAWREDASNEDPAYSRNYIRNRILPLLKERFPMADDSILSLSGIAGETISLVDGMVEKHYPGIVHDEGEAVYIEADALTRNYPLFAHVTSSLIRGKFNHFVNRRMIEELFSKYLVKKANVRLYADKTITAEKIYGDAHSRLRLSGSGTAEAPPVQWMYRVEPVMSGEQTIELAEIGISVTIKAVDYAFFYKFRKNSGYIFVTLENDNESLYIRNRRKGDIIHTEKGSKKIKELFIEKKLDNACKDRVPILLAGERIIACMPGFLRNVSNRVAADFLVDKNSKKVIAVIKNQ